jgi:hypothetical protein
MIKSIRLVQVKATCLFLGGPLPVLVATCIMSVALTLIHKVKQVFPAAELIVIIAFISGMTDRAD